MKRKSQSNDGEESQTKPSPKKMARSSAQQGSHQSHDVKQEEQPVKQHQHEDSLNQDSKILPSPGQLKYLHDEIRRLQIPVFSVEEANGKLGSNPYKLGAGGNGEAFLNKETRIVAKFSFCYDTYVSFLKEAEWMMKLEDVPGIQRLVGMCPERFMMLTVFGGPTLQKFLKWKRRLTSKQWLQVAIDLIEVFQRLHSRDVIHNDIKSSNICVNMEGNNIKVIPIDFGLTKSAGELVKKYGEFMGLRNFAPEFYQKPQGARCNSLSDIYSIGRVIYQIVQALDCEMTTPLVYRWVIESQRLCPTDRHDLDTLLKAIKRELRRVKLRM